MSGVYWIPLQARPSDWQIESQCLTMLAVPCLHAFSKPRSLNTADAYSRHWMISTRRNSALVSRLPLRHMKTMLRVPSWRLSDRVTSCLLRQPSGRPARIPSPMPACTQAIVNPLLSVSTTISAVSL